MNKTDKYFKLMALLFGGFIGFILLIVVIFYLLKLCSITLFHIPGFDSFFQFVIIIVPYIIFFAGYYYMHKKIPQSKSKVSAFIARVFMIAGSLLCACTLVLSTLKLFGVQKSFVLTYEDNSQYALIAQVVTLFFTALIIATGDAKEKDWIYKNSEEPLAD